MEEHQQHPDETLPQHAPEPKKIWQQSLKLLREVLETIFPAVFIALLINLFLAQATRVYGQSMEPTLHNDQRLVVEKISYRFHGPRRGNVVVIRMGSSTSELLIKRVVGLSGEEVAIRDGQVYIDDRPLNEPYVTNFTYGDYGPEHVPPLHVFVLGDNRGFSNDSRSFGMVPIERVVGRAWFSYWPLDRLGFVQ
jgi:signal peptidase I